MKTVLPFLLLLLGLPVLVSAQNSKFIQFYENADYEKCMKFCEKALDKDSKNLEALLYKSMVYTQWMGKSSEQKDYKLTTANARNKALVALASLKKKDRTGKFIQEHREQYDFVRLTIIKQADQFAEDGEMEQAQELYMSLMNRLQDWTINFYVGCSWIKHNDAALGAMYLNKGVKAYVQQLKNYKYKPEDQVYSFLTEAIKGLTKRGLYLDAMGAFNFIAVLFEQAPQKEMEETYFFILKTAMYKLTPDNDSYQKVLLAYNQVLTKYPDKIALKEWKTAFVQNGLEWLLKASYDDNKTKNVQSLITAYQYTLDNVQQPKHTLQEINTKLLTKIHQLYPENDQGEAKSLMLYELFKVINEQYHKEEKAVDFFLNYGTKESLQKYCTTLLIYNATGGDVNKIASQLKELESKMDAQIQQLNNNYEDLDQVVYWLRKFPEFAKLKSTTKAYFLKKAKLLIDNNAFARAGLFLRRAQDFFPEEEGFKKLNKTRVEKDYKVNYLGSLFDDKTLNWTGSVTNCIPGKVSKTAKEKTVQQYDFARRLLVFPDGTVFNDEESKYCQAGALCMLAEGELSHNPDKNWKCYSGDAARGAHNSLGMGHQCDNVIFGMIEDVGALNKATGHRNNLLTPKYKGLVYGATTSTVAISATSYQRHSKEVLDRFDTDFISWPPQGPVPAQFIFDRWSFKSYNHKFRFENAKVKMYLNGKALDLDLEYESSVKLGWIPEGIDTNATEEQTVKVVIELDVQRDYKKEYQQEKFEYEVIILPIKK